MLVVPPLGHDTLHSRPVGHATPPSPLPLLPPELPGRLKLLAALLPLPLPPPLLLDPPHEQTLVMATSSIRNAIGPRVERRMTTSLAGTTLKKEPTTPRPERRPRDAGEPRTHLRSPVHVARRTRKV